MDEQNYENGQFNQNEFQSTGNAQQNENNNYQDYTNMQYQAPYDYNSGRSDKANGMQIASLVLGVFGILTCCCWGLPGIVLGVIGLILAIVGNKKSNSKGIGIAGLVCSIIAIVFGTLALIYFIFVYATVYQELGPYIQSYTNGEITYEELMEELMLRYGAYN